MCVHSNKTPKFVTFLSVSVSTSGMIRQKRAPVTRDELTVGKNRFHCCCKHTERALNLLLMVSACFLLQCCLGGHRCCSSHVAVYQILLVPITHQQEAVDGVCVCVRLCEVTCHTGQCPPFLSPDSGLVVLTFITFTAQLFYQSTDRNTSARCFCWSLDILLCIKLYFSSGIISSSYPEPQYH